MNPDLLTESYDYPLPPERIATHPVHPADAARLLIYNRVTQQVMHRTVRDLPDLLPPDTAILFNDTRVIKARLFGRKSTGGKIELLLNKPLPDNRYSVLIRGKVAPGTELRFDEGLTAVVEALHADGSRTVRFEHSGRVLPFGELVELCDRIGHIPLPPYIERPDTPGDARDYQNPFAAHAGAVAAPTASLHFTPELIERLQQRFTTQTLTLHVGAGTFKPVEAERIDRHPMHSEYFRIPVEATELIRSPRPLLAVGTTVTRTVEYFARTGRTEGECDLFLHPGNPPVRVDHLMTNFHLPKSTLIMLVSAFVGRERTLELYREAIEEGYRFYSYGDAMLIL